MISQLQKLNARDTSELDKKNGYKAKLKKSSRNKTETNHQIKRKN